jgi:hypothetical protein
MNYHIWSFFFIIIGVDAMYSDSRYEGTCSLGITAFRDVMPCNLIEMYRRLRQSRAS